MNNLLYYPSFTVENKTWLKFALLYFDDLSPIIPSSGDAELNKWYKKLIKDTNLITPYRPDNKEGFDATLDAIEHIDKIFKEPQKYKPIFGESNFIERWEIEENQQFTIFNEKYNQEWETYCIQSGIGHSIDQGVNVPKDVAYLYMTILAHAISEQNGMSPITDHQSLDKFSIFARSQTKPDKNKIDIAQAVINLSLPTNLEQIPLEKIIEHRNRTDFLTYQRAFHDELSQYLANISNSKNVKDFKESLGNVWKDFQSEILKLGTGISSFGLGVWLLVDTPQSEFLEGVQKGLAGLNLAVGSAISIKNTWENTRTKRFTRKYLSNLNSIAPYNSKSG